MSEPTTSLPLDLMSAGSRFASAPALLELEGGALTVESSLDPPQAVRARGSARRGSALRRRVRKGGTSGWRVVIAEILARRGGGEAKARLVQHVCRVLGRTLQNAC